MSLKKMKYRWLFSCLIMVCLSAAALADMLPLNQIPMYGEREKTDAMKQADAAFIASVEQQGLSHEEGAKQAVRAAWSYWAKQDYETAIKRFNQAWLLDPENGNAYHGFALITSVHKGTPEEVERFFKLAISKTKVDANAFVDYGRFLWTQKQLDKSLVQLNKALELSSTAHNARAHISFVYYLKKDFANACVWAKDAAKNGDELERGYQEDMCGSPKPQADNSCAVSVYQGGALIPGTNILNTVTLYDLKDKPFSIKLPSASCKPSLGVFSSFDKLRVLGTPKSKVFTTSGFEMAGDPDKKDQLPMARDPERILPDDMDGMFGAEGLKHYQSVCNEDGKCPIPLLAFRSYWNFLEGPQNQQGNQANINPANWTKAGALTAPIPLVVYTETKRFVKPGSSSNWPAEIVLDPHSIFLVFHN